MTPALRPTVIVTTAADAGPGSLRAAVADASDGAVIGFDPALTGQTIAFASTIQLDQSVTLDGSAAPGLTLDGGDAVRLFQGNTDAPRRFAFFSLRLIRGSTDGSGGALSFNGENLEVEVGGCSTRSTPRPCWASGTSSSKRASGEAGASVAERPRRGQGARAP